jgi:hypothetical protein
VNRWVLSCVLHDLNAAEQENGRRGGVHAERASNRVSDAKASSREFRPRQPRARRLGEPGPTQAPISKGRDV